MGMCVYYWIISAILVEVYHMLIIQIHVHVTANKYINMCNFGGLIIYFIFQKIPTVVGWKNNESCTHNIYIRVGKKVRTIVCLQCIRS